MKPISQVNFITALVVWFLTLAVLWPRAVFAASSLANDIRKYDVESLGWAILMSLLGGALRTIFTLATDTKVVRSFGIETLKDAVVAVIAGILAYIVLEAFRAFNLLPVASEVRLAIILFAGWSRMSFFGWLNRLGTKVTDSVNDRISTTIAGGGGGQRADDVGRVNPVNPVDILRPLPPADTLPEPKQKPKPFQELK